MNTTYGSITQPSIKAKLLRKNTYELALLMFHETRGKNLKIFLGCQVVSFIQLLKIYFFIDYLACK